MHSFRRHGYARLLLAEAFPDARTGSASADTLFAHIQQMMSDNEIVGSLVRRSQVSASDLRVGWRLGRGQFTLRRITLFISARTR